MKYKVKISNFVFGVPATFIVAKYNPEQFEIITCACGNSWANYKDALISLNYDASIPSRGGTPVLDGKLMYTRILIREKQIVNNYFLKF